MTKQKAEKILKQVQNDKNVETGRSMTEMLGVLAIIGVLSIGGIAGYTYAMERHYTNEILNAASQRAIVIASQIAAGRQVSLTEFDGQTEVAGGTFDSTVEEWVDGFGIKVTGVKESVCQKLLKATEGTDIILAKTDGVDLTEADCSGGSFLITYSNDLGKRGEDGGVSDPTGCDESEKITKYYYTGDCCDEATEGLFCPGESVPTCTISNNKKEECITNCECDYDSNGRCCCNESVSEECCKMSFDNAVGLDRNGECCLEYMDDEGYCCSATDESYGCCAYYEGFFDKNGVCCYSEADSDGNCCDNDSVSDECCIASGGSGINKYGECCYSTGVDKNGECCYMHLDNKGICCDSGSTDSAGNCCVTGEESDECCKLKDGNGFDKNGKCCDTNLDSAGNCCVEGEESDECCQLTYGSASIGLDKAGVCCLNEMDKYGYCCYEEVDENGECCFGHDSSGNCCKSINDSDECCIAVTNGVGLDRYGECCYGGSESVYLDENKNCIK